MYRFSLWNLMDFKLEDMGGALSRSKINPSANFYSLSNSYNESIKKKTGVRFYSKLSAAQFQCISNDGGW